MKRRTFCKKALMAGGSVLLSPLVQGCSPSETPATSDPSAYPSATNAPSTTPSQAATTTPSPQPTLTPTPDLPPTQIALVKTADRAEGTRRVMELLGINPVSGKTTFLKPNFNSNDEAPGSTHADTLRALVTGLVDMGAQSITIGDRSGMGSATAIMRMRGVPEMVDEFGIEYYDFVRLPHIASTWEVIDTPGLTWKEGFAVPRMFLESEAVVQTCCLKTHVLAGFTMSLKNSVGFVPGSSGFAGSWPRELNYMPELHGSLNRLIPEINTVYDTALIVMDGVAAYIDGGPDIGTIAHTEIMVAGTDRVAVDAVGLAVLRLHGSKVSDASKGKVFAHPQLRRAAELGVGVGSPDKIEFITGDAESDAYAEQIKEYLG